VTTIVCFLTMRTMYVQGTWLLECCKDYDYTVTVGGVDCPVNVVLDNALSCSPKQEKPPESDFDAGGSRVLVTFLALYFTPSR